MKKEVGVYYWKTGEYKKLISFDEMIGDEDSIGLIPPFDDGKILIATSKGGMDTFYNGKLWMYDIENENLELIHTNFLDETKTHNNLIPDNYVFTEDGIYFCDCYYNEDKSEYVSNLYFYDYSSKETILEREYGLYPLKYKDKYIYYTTNDEGIYDTIIDYEGNLIWKHDEYCCGIVSNGEEMFLELLAFDYAVSSATKTVFTTLDKKPILTTYSSMYFDGITDKYLFWSFLKCVQKKEYPIIYDIKEEKILILDMLPYAFDYKVLSANENGFLIKLYTDREEAAQYYYVSEAG